MALAIEGVNRRFPSDVEVAIYRAVQEALTNVARHAQASEAVVRVEQADGQVHVTVEDNGRGMTADAAPHLGWLGMRERVTALGGRLDVGRAGAGGVRLDAWIPLGDAS